MQDWTPDTLKTELDAGSTVFLKLYKPGCGICELSRSATDRLEAKNHDVHFGAIDVEAHPEMLELAKTDVLPVFFVFREHKMKGKVIGFKGQRTLEDLLGE